jgi:glycosyltransferase involved in cell wall biosynthesis
MMISVAHLLDDGAVGGVSRGLADRIARLPGNIDCKQFLVQPARSITPPGKRDVAIIHYTMSWAKLPYLVMLRTQYGSSPIIIVEHSYTQSFERLHVKNKRRFRSMLRMNYKLADFIVAVSYGQARWMIDAGLVPPEKLIVIRSATDCSQLFDLPPPHRTGGPLRLAAYGRFNGQKAFEVLIDAMKLVPCETAHLTLAGYGDLESQLRSRAALVPNITIQGKIDGGLAEFLSKCDAVIVPSRFEAFGIVAVEARSAARPIIVTDVDGLAEQVAPECGLVVPPEDAAELAKAILRINQMDITKLGLAARESARGHFETNLSQWSALLERVNYPRPA